MPETTHAIPRVNASSCQHPRLERCHANRLAGGVEGWGLFDGYVDLPVLIQQANVGPSRPDYAGSGSCLINGESRLSEDRGRSLGPALGTGAQNETTEAV